MKNILQLTLYLLLATGCSVSSSTNKKATISCFKKDKMILRMKANSHIKKSEKPLFKFKDDRDFVVEIYKSCVIIYTDNLLYERVNR